MPNQFPYLNKEEKEIHIKKVLADCAAIINDSGSNTLSESFRDIIAGIRGPDDDNYHVKSVTTACIRSAIGITPRSGLVVMPLDCYKEPDPSLTTLHFSDHINRAIKALKLLGLWRTDAHL